VKGYLNRDLSNRTEILFSKTQTSSSSFRFCVTAATTATGGGSNHIPVRMQRPCWRIRAGFFLKPWQWCHYEDILIVS
jgi:hypothetical protein